MKNPKSISITSLVEIVGVSKAELESVVAKAKATTEKIKFRDWFFWYLGEEDEDGNFYGNVWAFAPNKDRYIIL